MNGRKSFLVAAALLAFAFPATLGAQSIYVSGGVTFPTSDYGDISDTGWMAAGGVLFPVGPAGLSIGAEGFYGQNSAVDEGSEIGLDDPKLYGGMGIVVYTFQTRSSIEPYVFGGAGIMALKLGAFGESDTESGFGYQFGAGLGFPLSPKVSLYGEGRYMGGDISDATVGLFGIFAGLTFGLGSSAN